jgi:hypothetical protein
LLAAYGEGITVEAGRGRDRRDVHHRAAPAGQHLPADQLGQREQPDGVGLELTAEPLGCLVFSCHGLANARIVHEHVDLTVPFECCGHDSLAVR